MVSLQQVGEELVGQARCPFQSAQSNVALFAGKSTHTHTGLEAKGITALIM